MIITDPTLMRQLLTEEKHCFRDPSQSAVKYIIGDQAPATMAGGIQLESALTWLDQNLSFDESWDKKWQKIATSLVSKAPKTFIFNINKATNYFATQVTIKYILGPSFANQEITDSVDYLNHVIPWLLEQKKQVESLDQFMIVPDKSKPIARAIESIKEDLESHESLIAKMYKSEEFSDEQVVQMGKWIFYVLHGMVASLASSALYCAASNPEWQKLLLDEEAGASDLELFMKEVIRLYPPTWMIKRRTIEGVRIGQTRDLIPPESDVLFSPYFSQRDVTRWPNPENFNPQRHSNKENPPMSSFGMNSPQVKLEDLVVKMSQSFLVSMLEQACVALSNDHPTKVEGKRFLGFVPDLNLKFMKRNVVDKTVGLF